MTFDSVGFARKYAKKYTLILALMLIVPLIFYMSILLQADKARGKSLLEKQVETVIVSMNEYNNEGVYTMPTYPGFGTALYSKQYKTIYSTLIFDPMNFSPGFYTDEEHYYLIYTLPESQYFGSSYLIVSTSPRTNEIYMLSLIGILLISISLFILSFRLLKNFSKPFEDINHQLDTFIKDSMHEINTPLSIININADLFANKYGDNKYLQRMKSASKTLATIYDDMDYLIKQGRVEHKIKDINISEFIENRVDYFKGIATLKHIEIKTEIRPELMYRFSKTKLQRIVDNT
ncbi:MAG TPA: HAMP domain-containing histidine kinase, partial [Flavobacteriaceae bacterium]|nr:HAMP domain-containing histidine kinase [Flavobacteriaceae bacterium]